MHTTLTITREVRRLVGRVRALLVLRNDGKDVSLAEALAYSLDMAESALLEGMRKPKKKEGK